MNDEEIEIIGSTDRLEDVSAILQRFLKNVSVC